IRLSAKTQRRKEGKVRVLVSRTRTLPRYDLRAFASSRLNGIGYDTLGFEAQAHQADDDVLRQGFEGDSFEFCAGAEFPGQHHRAAVGAELDLRRRRLREAERVVGVAVILAAPRTHH